MPRLTLHLLGGFEARLEGEPITRFESAKTQALLAYLALEPDRPHSRLKLATLLWPDKPDATARSNLRHALSSLRGTVGDRISDSSDSFPLLLATRETVQFNSAGDCWVDALAFRRLVSAGIDQDSARELEDAVSLYRGELLEGFSVRGSPVFEDWMLLTADRMERQAALALQALVTRTIDSGHYGAARRYAWRWVELQPWQETAHLQLMQVLAASGRRTEALAQYEACRRMLKEEFGAEPSLAVEELHEKIRDGEGPPVAAIKALEVEHSQSGVLAPQDTGQEAFVARERELAQLQEHLDAAREGYGHVVFVTGEAGSGKTALMGAFTRAAEAVHSDLVVLRGSCNAYTGVGDPYLPFRTILAQAACGDATGGGRPSRDRLVVTGSVAMQALVNHGADLVDVFVPTTELKRRLAAERTEPAWGAALRESLERARTQPPSAAAQDALFDQYTAVVRSISKQVPLVLVVDDLQWVDPGSASLLFHLGKGLRGSRILVICAYRPEEVALGRSGGRHPLAPVVHEFRRDWGNVVVDLHLADRRSFVTALIGSEANVLGPAFEATLYRRTNGHALYTVELLRGMQARGDLICDVEGRWMEGPMINWDILPSRVEAVIAERIERLSMGQRQLLRHASVEGEEFTAEVVASSLGGDLDATIASLSGELDRRHRLVRALRVQERQGKRLSRYRFRHFLFQRYLYDSLDEVERAHLHERVGRALEQRLGPSPEAIAELAPQLAWHCEQAGLRSEAVSYYELAAQRAVRMLAYEEAIGHYTHALEALAGLPASTERDAREVALRIAVAMPTMMQKSWGAPELLEHYGRAEDLAESLDDAWGRLVVLNLVNSYYAVRAMHRRAADSARRLLQQAERLEIPYHVMAGHTRLSVDLMFLGAFSDGLEHLERMLPLYDSMREEVAANRFDADPKVGALAFAAYSYLALGHADRALQAVEAALVLSREIGDPLSVYFAIAAKGRVQRRRCDSEMLAATVDALHAIWTDFHLPMGEAEALMNRGWLLAERCAAAEGIPLFEQGLAIWDQTGMANHLTEFHSVLAEMCAKANQPARGLELIEGALAYADRTGERYHEAELYRLRGELRLQQDADHITEAADDFRTAIQIARRQAARSLELRAAISSCRLWRGCGKKAKLAEARAHLAETYAWFTEGFGTRDMQEARALLDAVPAA